METPVVKSGGDVYGGLPREVLQVRLLSTPSHCPHSRHPLPRRRLPRRRLSRRWQHSTVGCRRQRHQYV